MGQTTPNIGIYIPAAGETNYDQSFASGMVNVDQHDHSGGPNKGVPIGTSGIADGAITYNLLNADVADNTTGIGTNGALGANQLALLGFIKSMYQLVSNGLISKNGAVANARTITPVANQTSVTNGDGVAGNPTVGLASTVLSTTQPAFNAFLSAAVTNATGNGAIYTVLCDDIEKNQPGTPYSAGTGLFTAPVTGTYLFIGKVRLSAFATATDSQIRVSTSGGLIIGDEGAPSGASFYGMSVSGLATMTAGDTAALQVQLSGMAGNTATVQGSGTDSLTFFSGYLLF